MKFVDYVFISIMGIFSLIYILFNSIPTDHKLHVDEELGVAFVTNVGRAIYEYDGDDIKFSTGETVFVPNRSDKQFSFYRNRVLVMVNKSMENEVSNIINEMANRMYLNPENYNLIVLPFDLDLHKLKYIIINYNQTGDGLLNNKIKIKRYDLDLVPFTY